MLTSEDYALPQAARRIGIAVETLRRWIKEGLVPSHTKDGGKRRRLSQDTVADLANLRQAQPDSEIKLVLRRRQLGTLSTKEAAARIGVSAYQLEAWARSGRIADLIRRGGVYHFPIPTVDHLAEINHDCNREEASDALDVDGPRIQRWSAKHWIRRRTFLNGRYHYLRADVAFWRGQMREPWRRNAVLKLLGTPIDIIDELTLHTEGNPLSPAAQRLIENTDRGVLQTALAFRRRLIASQPPT